MTLPASDHLSLFDPLRKAAGEDLVRAFNELLPRIADEVRAQVDHSGDLRVEMALTEAALVLRDEIDIRSDVAAATLDECHVRSLQRSAATEGLRAADFSLLSDVDLAEQLVATALAMKVRESLGEAYPAYLSRLSQLTGSSADDENSPLGAQALALAVASGLRPYAVEAMTRDAVEEALLRFAVEPLRQIIAAADRRMVKAGILSMLPRIVVQPAPGRAEAVVRSARGSAQLIVAPPLPGRAADQRRSAAQAEPVPPAPPAKSAQSGRSTPARSPDPIPPARPAEAILPARVAAPAASDSAPTAVTPAADRVPASPAEPADDVVAAARRIVGDVKASMVLGEHPIVGERDFRAAFRHAGSLPRVDALERDAIAFAHQVGHAPFSAGARKAFFERMRGSMRSAGVPSAQLATLDVVSAMFDYTTDNERIPEPAKPLLWRLQMPAVTLACLDSGYLGDESRSVRRLVEHVAAIATAYPDELSRGSEMHGRLQTVVRAVEVVAHAFQVRSQVLSEQVKREYRRANHGMGTLVSKVSRARSELEANAGRRNRRDYRRRPSRERELEVSSRLEQLLDERLRDRHIPESVADFLKGVWLRHLRTAILRDGEESPTYQAALKVVDDLLWTLDGKGREGRQSRNELAVRIPEMLRILTLGISDIGSRPEDHRAFFDEMFLIHLRRMQKRGKSGRSEALPLDALTGSELSNTGIDDVDLPVLETPIAGAATARRMPPPKAGAVEPPAPAPISAAAPKASGVRSAAAEPVSSDPASPKVASSESATDAGPVPTLVPTPDLTILPPAPPRQSGFDELGPLSDARNWPELSPEFIDEIDDAVASRQPPAGADGDRSGGLPESLRGRLTARARPVDDDESQDGAVRPAPPEQAPSPRPRPPAPRPDPDAQSASELKLRRLIDSTSLDDAPRRPERMALTAAELGRDLAPGQWLELITSSRKRILAKVAWINERRSVVLLLQHPDRLILSRHVAALMDRAERKRVFRVR